jgi:hypothetical protein
MIELHCTGPGRYDVTLNDRVTHKVAKIKVRNDGSVKYANGFKPTHLDRWVLREVDGTYEGCRKFFSLKNLIDEEFPFTRVKRVKNSLTNFSR